MKNPKFLIIALLSLSLISLELVWTRIFSAEFFYTFAYLILSLSILGLGLGALVTRLFPALNNTKILSAVLTLTGVMILAGPPLVFVINLDFTLLFTSGLIILKLVLVIILLSSAFFLGGIALALLFKTNYSEMPDLYMADLLGAAAGVLFSVVLMNWFGTPVASFLSSLPVLFAALILSKKWFKTIPALFILTSIVLSVYSESILEVNREERAPVIYKHWDAVSKIKIYEYSEDSRGINIDNAANTPVEKFDGNWNRADSMKLQFTINVSYLIKQFDSCTFLSLGSGGGQDVLQALQENANEIHAVEVNPHINFLMTQGMLTDYSGKIYQDSRVKVITEDARAYVRRFNNKFDVIYSLSSNSFAALASGAFALAENYLFTKEAFKDYWNAMSNKGFMMMEHQFYIPRLVSELCEALDEMEVANPCNHFAVYNLPGMRRKILLVSKQELNDELLTKAFGKTKPGDYNFSYLLYPAADSIKDNLINQIVLNGWELSSDKSAIDISPCTDNRPFTAQLGMWKNFDWNKLDKITPYEFFGFPLSKIIITVTIIVVLFLIVPLNLLPLLFKGKKLRFIPWLYFFTIGMAFMIVEVILIQKYTFFIGPSVYSIITILLALLVSSGIGSRLSRNISNKTAFFGIIIWLLLDVFVFKHIIYSLVNLELIPRMILTALIIAPLGFFMGMPFPKAALKVGELIDWGFAVNGAASVLGSTIIILIAISFGFNTALIIGASLYLIAYFFLSLEKAW